MVPSSFQHIYFTVKPAGLKMLTSLSSCSQHTMDFTTGQSAVRGLLKRLDPSAPEYSGASALQKVLGDGKSLMV